MELNKCVSMLEGFCDFNWLQKAGKVRRIATASTYSYPCSLLTYFFSSLFKSVTVLDWVVCSKSKFAYLLFIDVWRKCVSFGDNKSAPVFKNHWMSCSTTLYLTPLRHSHILNLELNQRLIFSLKPSVSDLHSSDVVDMCMVSSF